MKVILSYIIINIIKYLYNKNRIYKLISYM